MFWIVNSCVFCVLVLLWLYTDTSKKSANIKVLRNFTKCGFAALKNETFYTVKIEKKRERHCKRILGL
jgi:hypothetical protein